MVMDFSLAILWNTHDALAYFWEEIPKHASFGRKRSLNAIFMQVSVLWSVWSTKLINTKKKSRFFRRRDFYTILKNAFSEK